MLARRTADDWSRQRFVLAFKRFVEGKVRPHNRQLYERRAAPAYERAHGRPPRTRDEARSALLEDPLFQTFSALKASSQDMLWQTVSEAIRRDEERLRATADKLAKANSRKGSFDFDPDFVPPEDVTLVDIHRQPRGYVTTDDDKDVLAGAIYEMGGNIYSQGRGMGVTDSKAGAVIAYLGTEFPGFSPKRILDMGSSAGASSCPYADAFPDAEVHAIDVGEAMVRYAHARAEALGVPVNFHVRSAHDTKFPDNHFDLVVSHNMMHEISDRIRRGMLKETFRILKPGGIAIHQDVMVRYKNWSAFEQAERGWDQDFNNEPFWNVYGEADVLSEAAREFGAANVKEIDLAKIDGPGAWYAVVAVKPGA